MGLVRALDQETNDLYVGDLFNERVSKFNESGTFLLAWGGGVNESSLAEEFQSLYHHHGMQEGISGIGSGRVRMRCSKALR